MLAREGIKLRVNFGVLVYLGIQRGLKSNSFEVKKCSVMEQAPFYCMLEDELHRAHHTRP